MHFSRFRPTEFEKRSYIQMLSFPIALTKMLTSANYGLVNIIAFYHCVLSMVGPPTRVKLAALLWMYAAVRCSYKAERHSSNATFFCMPGWLKVSNDSLAGNGRDWSV